LASCFGRCSPVVWLYLVGLFMLSEGSEGKVAEILRLNERGLVLCRRTMHGAQLAVRYNSRSILPVARVATLGTYLITAVIR